MKRLILAGAAMAALSASAFADDMFRGVSTLAADGGDSRIQFEAVNPDIMRMSVGDRITLNFGQEFEAELDRV
jgi:hypothetical protein